MALSSTNFLGLTVNHSPHLQPLLANVWSTSFEDGQIHFFDSSQGDFEQEEYSELRLHAGAEKKMVSPRNSASPTRGAAPPRVPRKGHVAGRSSQENSGLLTVMPETAARVGDDIKERLLLRGSTTSKQEQSSADSCAAVNGGSLDSSPTACLEETVGGQKRGNRTAVLKKSDRAAAPRSEQGLRGAPKSTRPVASGTRPGARRPSGEQNIMKTSLKQPMRDLVLAGDLVLAEEQLLLRVGGSEQHQRSDGPVERPGVPPIPRASSGQQRAATTKPPVQNSTIDSLSFHRGATGTTPSFRPRPRTTNGAQPPRGNAQERPPRGNYASRGNAPRRPLTSAVRPALTHLTLSLWDEEGTKPDDEEVHLQSPPAASRAHRVTSPKGQRVG